MTHSNHTPGKTPAKSDQVRQLTLEDFQKFREYFYRKTGIFFEDNKRYFVDKRIIERMELNHSSSFREYFTLLRFQASSEEMQALTNLMTVNETYFFREEYQFKCLVNSVLPEIVKNRATDKAIRIWSMPSSSGEEPYSIAIYLTEFWRDIERFDVELLASDIDTRILDAARQGIYSKRAVQHLPDHILNRYFARCGTDSFQLGEDMRQSVEFTQCNLHELRTGGRYSKFDVIFCRNLLIYFDDVSRRRAAETFYEALNPGGFICLGHSESMSRISSLFRIRRFADAIIYQKPF